MKETTIYDIAERLGLSASTVSRAVAGSPLVAGATRKKIQETASAMGYRVNGHARSLRTDKNSKLIGVILHRLNSQFSINALYSIEKYVRSRGYGVIISHSSESSEQEAQNAAHLFDRRVDGLVAALASDTGDMAHLARFTGNGIPVVLFDRVRAGFPCVRVVLDNYRAAYDATAHLVGQGCTRIVHVGGRQDSDVYRKRLRGYKKALSDHGIPYRRELVLFRGLDAEAAPLLAEDIMALDPRPDAVFAVNDLCAVLCMKRLQEKGIRIPQDMAFVGFNNDTISTIIEPNLTTVNYSGMEMGELAGKCIIDRVQDTTRSAQGRTISMHAELIVRASSLKGGHFTAPPPPVP